MPTVCELFCECGALFVVYTRDSEGLFVPCPHCGGLTSMELPPSDWISSAEGFDEDGPDVQVVLVNVPR